MDISRDGITVDISRDGITVDISRDGITVDISRDGITVDISRVLRALEIVVGLVSVTAHLNNNVWDSTSCPDSTCVLGHICEGLLVKGMLPAV